MKDTIDMAREAKCGTPSVDGKGWNLWPNVEKLVELIRTDEREKAEERVTTLYEDMENPYLPDIIKAIRRADT
jgi:hypothetical protein